MTTCTRPYWFDKYFAAGEKLHGTPGYFAPKMQKRALKNKKEPLRNAIDCNVKSLLNLAYSQ